MKIKNVLKFFCAVSFVFAACFCFGNAKAANCYYEYHADDAKIRYPLHYAVYKLDYTKVEQLCSSLSIDKINSRDMHSMSPLMVLCSKHYPDELSQTKCMAIAEWLLSYGAKRDDFQKMQHFSGCSQCEGEIHYSDSPMYMAIMHENFELAKRLVFHHKSESSYDEVVGDYDYIKIFLNDHIEGGTYLANECKAMKMFLEQHIESSRSSSPSDSCLIS